METQTVNTYAITQEAYLPTTQQFDGRQYIVVPVVMMVEGVHSGSRGPLLHTAAELGKITEAWNGIPITLSHPQVENMFVSANSPQVLTDYQIGRVFNAVMDGKKLKAEAWIDVQALLAKDPATLAKIQAGEVMEVSVGVFSEEVDEEGTYENEEYKAIATNLRPDHLALLPGEVGACSVNDGCGLRVNVELNAVENTDVDLELVDNSESKNNEQKKEVKMCEKCKEKANALIAHAATHFNESDREWLEALTEDKLDKLIPKVVQVNATSPSLDDAWKVINANAKTIEDYTAKLPEEIKAKVEVGMQAYKEMRDNINQNIVANTAEGTWTPEELDGMSLEMLQKIEKSVVKADYSINGQRTVTTFESSAIRPMLPGGVVV